MPSGIVVLLLLTLAALALVQRRVVRRWARPRARAAGNVGLGIAVVLTAATVVGFLANSGTVPPGDVRWISAAGLTWLATVFYLLLTAIALGLLWLVVRVAALVRPASADGGRRLLRVVAAVGVAASVIATGYGLVEAASPRVTQTPVRLAAMPAEFGPLTVALITDIHAGPVRSRSFVQRVVDQTNAQNPDLVILGGDLIDGTVARIGEDLTPLRDLRAPLGVLAVTGNHEYYADDAANWIQRWREVGVRPLVNESVRIERGGAAITVVGVNDRKGKAPLTPDYDAALAGVDPTGFSIAVAHEPLQAEQFARRGVDLQVSGHTHGGQLWPFRYVVRLQQPAVEGLEQVDGMPIYTSRGAGAWGPPVRVAAPPEIAVLQITP